MSRLRLRLAGWLDNVRLLADAHLAAMRARRTGLPYRTAFARAIRLLRAGRFRPTEALEIGLLHEPDVEASLRDNISKRALSAAQNRLNQHYWFYITEDKSIFYRFCQLHRIPHPRVRALLYRTSAGWSPRGLVRDSISGWAECFDTLEQHEVIVKPARGRHGKHVLSLVRAGREAWELNGKTCDSRAIAQRLWNTPDYDAWIVQDQLRLHESLAELTGTHTMQTIRAGTYVSPSGKIVLINAAIRMVARGNRTDNFLYGRTGNVLGLLNPRTGEISRTFGANPDGAGYQGVAEHPDTGRELLGWTVPDWNGVRNLLAEAAEMVLPLRTIGWDIAVADGGPAVIEGNFRYDPPIEGSLVPEARKLLAEGGEPEGAMTDGIIGDACRPAGPGAPG